MIENILGWLLVAAVVLAGVLVVGGAAVTLVGVALVVIQWPWVAAALLSVFGLLALVLLAVWLLDKADGTLDTWPFGGD
jgi:hypothetical protein